MNFRENLDNLIELFKKLREKSNQSEYKDLDPMLINNLDSLIRNYDMVKDSFPDEMLNKIGAPIQGIIEQAISQLKEQLGEDFSVETPIKEIKVESISDIDTKLKQPGLTPQEIDALLDKRAKMIS
jgi:sugar-specific transcriptional regulator TrmB